jgi:transcriptional regulator with XRE-family HTH domain
MSTSAEYPAGVPEFDLADRLRKALRTSGVGAIEMADYLGVSRNTVSNWINGHTPPRDAYLRLWALRTGVPFEWLERGEVTPTNGPEPIRATTDRYPSNVVTIGDTMPINLSPAQSVAEAA